MGQNTTLAITLVVFGSFCYALSASFQHRAIKRKVRRNEEKAPLGFRAFLSTIRSRRWLAGAGLLGVSALLQVIALSMAPVSVVQPVGLLAFPWSILIQARLHRQRIRRRVGLAVLLTVGATAAFTVLSALHAVPQSDLNGVRVAVGAAVVYLLTLAFGLLGARGPKHWRCLLWSSGGAMLYGLEAALVKSLIDFIRHTQWWHSPLLIGILAALVIGSSTAGWMIQQGFATGPSEIVVGSTTITSPVIAVTYGIAVLGEGRLLDNLTGGLMALFAALAVAGVVVLTRLDKSWDERPLLH
ncbi:EamA/RhaT family transporter [Raineyella fluvialis]|uniref:EamA/RhaT family transporter n=1 Tax=Raineyella fluvialis TaxID=2662261 RepID=A0A5Q2F867_9ACTN|nr:EamA/RhaT family transporter [Raineyella fluvialis]QGF23160.1 EamA/RhaT family transporter [Raineyella fluvialis]